jgi:hypothetical protein
MDMKLLNEMVAEFNLKANRLIALLETDDESQTRDISKQERDANAALLKVIKKMKSSINNTGR